MSLRKNRFRLFTIAAGLALGGCLISEAPLLDAKNGRAAPLDPGLYEACEHDGEGGEPECNRIDVSRDGAALYTFRAEDEDETTFARFRRLARGAWLTQLSGEEDEDYFYFLGETAGDDFVMAMIVCEAIPEAVRAKYSARGEMEVDEGKYASTCVAKTLRAAIAGAKAFRSATAPESRLHTVYRKLAEAEQE